MARPNHAKKFEQLYAGSPPVWLNDGGYGNHERDQQQELNHARALQWPLMYIVPTSSTSRRPAGSKVSA